jgi:hypothetical protein
MKQTIVVSILILSMGWSISAQANPASDNPPPAWDAKQFILKNHVHEIAGVTTLSLAALTGVAGATLFATNTRSGPWPIVHGALAYSTIAAGAATLTLGLTAYSNRLDEVWPHALLMGLAESGFIVNAFVLKPGSPPHEITGAASITTLGLGLLSIVLIKNAE